MSDSKKVAWSCLETGLAGSLLLVKLETRNEPVWWKLPSTMFN